MTSLNLCFLLGAGASAEAGVPMMAYLGEQFTTNYPRDWELLHQLQAFTRELKSLEPKQWTRNRKNVEALMRHLSVVVTKDEDPLRRRAAAILRLQTQSYILSKTSKHSADLSYLDGLRHFMSNNGGLDIFTLNYDRVIEDWSLARSIAVTDGFGKAGEWEPERLSRHWIYH